MSLLQRGIEFRRTSQNWPKPVSLHPPTPSASACRESFCCSFATPLPKQEVKFTRHNIFERDKNTRQYCGRGFDRKDLNLDHVILRDRGGPTTWKNIVCSCIECDT
jgi:5-methylcytosine-specific restriction endonuclease McrA